MYQYIRMKHLIVNLVDLHVYNTVNLSKIHIQYLLLVIKTIKLKKNKLIIPL